MDASTPDPQRPREYHVLVEGQMHGPFTMESLKAALGTGDVTPEDLVQVGGLPIWRPLRQVLESPEPGSSSIALPENVPVPPPLPIVPAEEVQETAVAEGAVAGDEAAAAEVKEAEEIELVESISIEELESEIPDWNVIGQTAWARLRNDFEERSVGTGLICLGVGVVACLATFWPFLFWLPWFGLAFFAGFDALKRGKTLQGVGLLVAACALPIAFSTLVLPLLRPRPEPIDLLSNGATSSAKPAPSRETGPVPRVDRSPRSSQPAVPVTIESVRPALGNPPSAPSPRSAPATPVPAPRQNGVPAARPVGKAPPISSPAEVPATKKSEPVLPSLGLTDLAPGKAIVGGDLVQKHRDCFVVVKDGSASGSGFVCRDGQKTWLFTNAHVAAGMRSPQFSRLDGSQIRVSSAEAGGARDVLRFAIADGLQPLDILPNLDASARIGDEVAVLGNSGGGGVVTSLAGKLVGIGPDRIEVSAEFIPGNSGSPIIHVPTGKVIGIATYLTKRYEEFTGASTGSLTPDGATVRRFGYRLDQIERWEPVNWGQFQAEAEQLRQISALTSDVFDFLDAVRRSVEPQFETDTLRRSATEWLTGIHRQNVSEVDRNRTTQAFLSSLRFMVRADVATAENRLRYSYFRERLRKEREVRDRLYKAFDDDVKKMVSPSMR